MGANGSTARKVSFGLDENEKVTVIEGVKLSEDVLRRMRESQGFDSAKPPKSKPDSHKPTPIPTGSSSTEIQEELRKDFERQQALVQEQLSRLAQRERETAVTAGLDDLTPALLIEKGKAHEEQAKVKMLARQLERKEKELESISCFYKDQLETLEKKTLHCSRLAQQYMNCVQQAKSALTNHG
ncbi:MICOS complex subunit mic25a-like isoform X2 [Scomber scombrus]|uniref:MICOS complex subunit mic25a-like isoform X2 n=1 Tax=Scomber scombrus TaxID=13677 RepID=A0AAV1NF91_SCOSC